MITLDQAGAGMPFLRARRAGPEVRHLALFSWVQGRTDAPAPSPWRIVPDTHPHIVHHRGLDGRAKTRLVGARSRHVDVEQRDRAFTVGIRLRPGVLPILARESAWNLRDRAVPLSDALGPVALETERIVADLDDPAAVERLLLDLLAGLPGAPVDWRASALVEGVRAGAGRPRDPVRDTARRLGVSDRSLRDVGRRSIGLRPKEVHRIQRLHEALRLGLAGRPDAEIAHRVGYSDQAHLVRESRALLGDTPRSFRARADFFNTPRTTPR